MEKYGFIYITTNKINGMKYIGKCVYSRKNGWKNYLGSGVYLKRAINKYGAQNFKREILEEANSEEELNSLEEKYILEFNAVESKEFYNLKYTSIGGDTFTHNPNKEHTRKLKSINSTGKNNPMYGVPKTQKMIDAVKKANSKQIEVDGVFYSSQTEFAKKFNIPMTTVSYRLNSSSFPNYIRIKKPIK